MGVQLLKSLVFFASRIAQDSITLELKAHVVLISFCKDGKVDVDYLPKKIYKSPEVVYLKSIMPRAAIAPDSPIILSLLSK